MLIFANFSVRKQNIFSIIFIFCDDKSHSSANVSRRLFAVFVAHLRIRTKSPSSANFYLVTAFNFSLNVTFHWNASLVSIFNHRGVGLSAGNFCCKTHFATNFASKENLNFIAFFYFYLAIFVSKFGTVYNAFAFCTQINKNS